MERQGVRDMMEDIRVERGTWNLARNLGGRGGACVPFRRQGREKFRYDTIQYVRRTPSSSPNELVGEDVSMTTWDNGRKECNDDAAAAHPAYLSAIDIYLSSVLQRIPHHHRHHPQPSTCRIRVVRMHSTRDVNRL